MIPKLRHLVIAAFFLSQAMNAQQGFHQFRVKNIFGDSISLASFAGTKLLVVNTASFCGYTYQFTKLRQLDSAWQSYGFRVIGFPSNDFGGQDPYADSTIYSFCLNQYAIQFPMMARISIVEGDTSPVYRWLQRKALNGVENVSVSWNFNKFLIDENGNWVRHFHSAIEPNDTAITNWIAGTVTPVTRPLTSVWKVFSDDQQRVFAKNTENRSPERLRIYSLQGRMMAEKNFSDPKSEEPLHAGFLPEGIYLAEILDGDRSQVFRLRLLR